MQSGGALHLDYFGDVALPPFDLQEIAESPEKIVNFFLRSNVLMGGRLKNLIFSAASKLFAKVSVDGNFIVALLSIKDRNYQCVFHGADQILRSRLFPLVDGAPIYAPAERREAVLQYFAAVNAHSYTFEGWLKLHSDDEICCQNEIVVVSSVRTLDDLLPVMVSKAGFTLNAWWPGIVDVANNGVDPTLAFDYMYKDIRLFQAIRQNERG